MVDENDIKVAKEIGTLQAEINNLKIHVEKLFLGDKEIIDSISLLEDKIIKRLEEELKPIRQHQQKQENISIKFKGIKWFIYVIVAGITWYYTSGKSWIVNFIDSINKS